MKNEHNASGRNDLIGAHAAPAERTVHVDVEKYQSYLDGSGMTEAEKVQYIEALWTVLLNFVELGFNVHPLQKVCERDFDYVCQRSNGPRDTMEPIVDEKTEDPNHLFPAEDPEDK